MRLRSLDIFRGLTVAGMIFVNLVSLGDLGDLAEAGKLDAKSWIGQLYLWIDHAPWHGSWNLADFVFPFFLHIVGVAMAFSLAKYSNPDENRPTRETYGRILRRVLLLVAIGLLINGLVYSLCKIPKEGLFNFGQLRFMGVLQRIGLAYGAAALIVLNLPKKAQWMTAGALLVGYWLLLAFVPAPDAPAGHFASGVAFFNDKKYNFASYIDRLIIPANHFHKLGKNGFDPEGLFSTLPAIVSVLLGYFNGVWLKAQRTATSNNSMQMAMFGLAAIVVGRIWGGFFPINKNLWTSSFVLFMAGWGLLLFALCYELIDVRGIGRSVAKPLEWMGLNALFAFVGSVFMIKIMYFNNIDGCGEKTTTVYKYLVDALFAWSGPANSVVLFAVLTVLFWNLLCYWMYRMNWLLKL
jgi:predicted acyltransferase